MAPWSFFQSQASELPAAAAPNSGDAFEVFIGGALAKIYHEASGRSKEHRAIREACKRILESLRAEEAAGRGKVVTPLEHATCAAVLEPLRLACAQDAPRLALPALACLHKLVAHAYLQAESTPAGRLDDGTAVAQVVVLASRCGEAGSDAVQLAVVRALLTVVTAEHFVVHGDCLMQALRTVFNVAIGSDSPDVQRTARNALLQMLNTVIKRVMQAQLVRQRARARDAPKEARITACMRSCAAHLGGEDLGGCA